MSKRLIRKNIEEKINNRNTNHHVTYELAKFWFTDKDYVSTGLLQYFLQVPYIKARYFLDRMIEEGFCEAQVGSYPCKVTSNRN